MLHDDLAVCIVEVQGLPPAVVVADTMVKAAPVSLVALEVNTLGALTIKATGETGAATSALEAGRELAIRFECLVGATLLPRYSRAAYPMWINCRPSTSGLLHSRNHLIPAPAGTGSTKAIGMLETRGYSCAVAALDAMLKSAEVALLAKEKIGQTRVSVLISGEVSAVAAALESGARQAQQVGILASTHLIPRPDKAIQSLFPAPSAGGS